MGFGKDGRGAIIAEQQSVGLTTLAQNTGKVLGIALAITEDFRMLKSRGVLSIGGVAVDETVDLVLYLCDGDLSVAEMEAKIELDGPLSRHDRIGNEIVERFVRKVALLSSTNFVELAGV